MVNYSAIEKRWQGKWKDLGTTTPDKRKKFFMIFAYPGISGYLHIGHMRGYTYTDMICRYKRMQGYNVLFPVGTHASGNMAFAFLRKIKENNSEWIQYLKINGATDTDIKNMSSTENIISYFNTSYINTWKRFGFLCDWNRFTSTSYPDYQRFITWQFHKLNNANLLTQKPYYATFCPEDGPVAVDPSETDISKGGKAEKQEYTILKFKLNEYYLIAATLRPETVFGQTNLWINPETMYMLVEVGSEDLKETWVLSSPATKKIAYQQPNIKIIGEISGKGLIGQRAKAPGINQDILILPARFCDPAIGTGIVTSVPSDAPYDWIALKNLQQDPTLCASYHLDYEEIKNIKPIPIIKSKGFGLYPAIEICKQMGITSQTNTEKLDIATKEIYKAGYHTGIMTDICGKFSGMRVEEAKELVKAWLIETGNANLFWDLSEEVICRCGKNIIIKRIEDQWFIKYSDENLTKKAKHCASEMNILPEEYKKNLPHILDWFSDRACARLGNWIGTKLPFDPVWTIEPIADSTLYPLYYLVSPYINTKEITPSQLTNEFFDYIFLGEGRPETIAKTTQIKKTTLLHIRKDVEYFYPLDINLGGKEHQTVHFPVFIMNHIGILPQTMWPRGIFTNAWIVGSSGTKVSKSKGGAGTLTGLIEHFGVDALRLYYIHIGSPHSDTQWQDETAHTYKTVIDRLYIIIQDLTHQKTRTQLPIDNWLISRIHSNINKATTAFEHYELRDVATTLYFSIYEDIKWYLKRGGKNTVTIGAVLNLWARMLMPITPHLAEEMWKAGKGKGLVAEQQWPNHNDNKILPNIESSEESLIRVVTDIRAVLKLAKIKKPVEITLFVAEQWKYTVCSILKKQLSTTRDIGTIMKSIMSDLTLNKVAQHISKIVPQLVKDPSRLPSFIGTQTEEILSLVSSQEYLRSEFGCKITIIPVTSQTHQKAANAMPGKPAILIT